MKKLLSLFLLTPLFITSQSIIKEDNFEKNNRPIELHYFSKTNEIGISYGTTYKLSTNSKINKIIKIDKFGKEQNYYEGESIMNPIWSSSGNTLKASKFSATSLGKKYLYVLSDDAKTEFRKYSDLTKSYFTSFLNFNDEFHIGFLNQNGKRNIDLEKDELYLEKRNLKTDKISKIKLDKPVISELTNKNYLKPYESNIFFKTKLLKGNKFEIITKAFTKDYKTSNVFRRVYDLDGNLLSNNNYKVNLAKGVMAYSKTGADYYGYSTHDVLNNIFVDSKSNEVYVYGLYSEKPKGYRIHNKILGYYIYKFSEDGNLIYKVQNSINDKEGLNRKMYWKGIISYMYVDDGKISLFINKIPQVISFTNGKSQIDKSNLFSHTFNLNALTGERIINKKKLPRSKTSLNFKAPLIGYTPSDFNRFLDGAYTERTLRKLRFNASAPAIIRENDNIKSYLKSLISRTIINIHLIKSSEGVWFIESDNKKYYKVLFFEN